MQFVDFLQRGIPTHITAFFGKLHQNLRVSHKVAVIDFFIGTSGESEQQNGF
jgi:hypothetical protein